MWGKVSCLRKQHDGRKLALNHQPSDPKSVVPAQSVKKKNNNPQKMKSETTFDTAFHCDKVMSFFMLFHC